MAFPGAVATQLVRLVCWGSVALLGAPAYAEDARLVFLNASNRPVGPDDGLAISRRITHDASLPRSALGDVTSPDSANFRLELTDPRENKDVVYATLEAVHDEERHGLLRHVPLLRVAGTARFRSPFVRLVADATDASAPDVGMQLLRARLGDHVLASLAAGSNTSARTAVGGRGQSVHRSLRGTLRLLVLRYQSGAAPVLGADDEEAIALARRQVEIANEIWAQCGVEFGAPQDAQVLVVDPPGPTLLAIADLDGLLARGDGLLRFRVGDRRIGPIATRANALPEQTALAIAREARRRGIRVELTVNPRADHGAHPSADLVFRDSAGVALPISNDGPHPLGSDSRQRVSLGSVDLADGLSEFDNTISAVGTLEERTLVKVLGDGDPTTIEVFLVNRFVNRDRQGEAFIETDGSSMANTLIFDRNAVRYERQAWVQAHELGHVLLDEPLHPDNVGPDRPWLLMDADARQGRVAGPKRLTDEECGKVRRRSGPEAHPVLLKTLP